MVIMVDYAIIFLLTFARVFSALDSFPAIMSHLIDSFWPKMKKGLRQLTRRPNQICSILQFFSTKARATMIRGERHQTLRAIP